MTSIAWSVAMFAIAAFTFYRGDHWAFVVLAILLGVFFLGSPINRLIEYLWPEDKKE